jgi:hypothetical protein
MYSNEDFEKRMGINIFQFIGKIKSNPNSKETENLKSLLQNLPTNGRKIRTSKKI